MSDIPGWFQHTSRDKLQELIKEHCIKDVIEVGSFLGLSTAFFAGLTGHVYAVDPFCSWPEGEQNGDARAAGPDFYYKFLFNMASRNLLGRISPLRLSSEDAAQLPIRADLVYLDAAHDYESVKRDITLWLPRANRILCGDDYDENWPGVVRAVDEAFGDKVQHYGNLWWVIPNEDWPE